MCRCCRRGDGEAHPTPARRGSPYAKRVQATAVAQIGSGAAAFIASLACHFDQCFAGFLAVGTWTGAFYAANGLLALASSRGGRSRLAITSMVLSLLAAMLSLMAIGMGVVGILVESDLRRYVAGSVDFQQDWYMASRCRGIDRRIFLHVVAVAAHAMQILASSFQSVFAFKRYVFFEATAGDDMEAATAAAASAAATSTSAAATSAAASACAAVGGSDDDDEDDDDCGNSIGKLAPECIPLTAMNSGAAPGGSCGLSPARQPLLSHHHRHAAAPGAGILQNAGAIAAASGKFAGNSPQFDSPRPSRLASAAAYDRSVSVSSYNSSGRSANWSPSVSIGRTGPPKFSQLAT